MNYVFGIILPKIATCKRKLFNLDENSSLVFTMNSKTIKNHAEYSIYECVNIKSCQFVQCTSNQGGAILCNAPTFLCCNSKFVYCTSDNGGGILLNGNNSTMYMNCFLGCSSQFRYHAFAAYVSNYSIFNSSSISLIDKENTQYTAGFQYGIPSINYINCSKVDISYFGGFLLISQPRKKITMMYCNIEKVLAMSLLHRAISKAENPGDIGKIITLQNSQIINNTILSHPMTASGESKNRSVTFKLHQCLLIDNIKQHVQTIELVPLNFHVIQCYCNTNVTLLFNSSLNVAQEKNETFEVFEEKHYGGDCESVKTAVYTKEDVRTISKGLAIGCATAIAVIIIGSIVVYCIVSKKGDENYQEWINNNSSSE